MSDRKSRPIFVGPSLGVSILCSIPLVAMKLLGVVEIEWIVALCPLWLGWAICFVLWLWFSTLSLICKCIKPIYIPVVVDSSASIEEKEEDNTERKEREDGM